MTNPESIVRRRSARLLGLSSHEADLRRSYRLLKKPPSMTMPKPPKPALHSHGPLPHSPIRRPCFPYNMPRKSTGWSYWGGHNLYHRMRRRIARIDFNNAYTYRGSKERRTLISSGNKKSKTIMYKNSPGITWVAMKSMDSICVAFRNRPLRAEYFDHSGLSKREILTLFGEAVLSEIEDLADPSIGSPNLFDLSIGKLLAVVSVQNDHGELFHKQDSCFVPAENKAVQILMNEVNCDRASGYMETRKRTVGALQCLFKKKFKAKEIRVLELMDNYICNVSRSDINKLLACINQQEDTDMELDDHSGDSTLYDYSSDSTVSQEEPAYTGLLGELVYHDPEGKYSFMKRISCETDDEIEI